MSEDSFSRCLGSLFALVITVSVHGYWLVSYADLELISPVKVTDSQSIPIYPLVDEYWKNASSEELTLVGVKHGRPCNDTFRPVDLQNGLFVDANGACFVPVWWRIGVLCAQVGFFGVFGCINACVTLEELDL